MHVFEYDSNRYVCACVCLCRVHVDIFENCRPLFDFRMVLRSLFAIFCIHRISCVYFMHTWIHFIFATYSHTRLYSAWNMFHSRFSVCFLARSHLCNVSSCHRICWLPLCNIQQLPAMSDIYSMFIQMKTRKWKWTNIVVNSFACFSLEITKTVCFFVLFIGI